MKLNLGCGRDRRDGYVNVDLRSDVADHVADVRDLKFPDESAEEILALDILEHFPASQVLGILAGWRRILAPQGRLVLRVPNLQELGRLIAEDGPHSAAYIRNVYGGHRWGPEGAWDTHHTGWTPRLLAETLAKARFCVLSNDGEANMTVVATCA